MKSHFRGGVRAARKKAGWVRMQSCAFACGRFLRCRGRVAALHVEFAGGAALRGRLGGG